jgi:hypothetical protein
MAFGQQSGPPASSRQVKELLNLLEQAGYRGFREARGPLGFTQRQGLGKFTQDEAAELIARLEATDDAAPAEPHTPPAPAATATKPSRAAARRVKEARLESILGQTPARMLAVELERRGWIVIPPEDQTATEPMPP